MTNKDSNTNNHNNVYSFLLLLFSFLTPPPPTKEKKTAKRTLSETGLSVLIQINLLALFRKPS